MLFKINFSLSLCTTFHEMSYARLHILRISIAISLKDSYH